MCTSTMNKVQICVLFLGVLPIVLTKPSNVIVDGRNSVETITPGLELHKGIPLDFKCRGPQKGVAHAQILCGGTLCLVTCKEHYKSLTKIPFVYKCHQNGHWSTIPPNMQQGLDIDWPVCRPLHEFGSNGPLERRDSHSDLDWNYEI